jgi:hypothetical protein
MEYVHAEAEEGTTWICSFSSRPNYLHLRLNLFLRPVPHLHFRCLGISNGIWRLHSLLAALQRTFMGVQDFDTSPPPHLSPFFTMYDICWLFRCLAISFALGTKTFTNDETKIGGHEVWKKRNCELNNQSIRCLVSLWAVSGKFNKDT